MMRLIRAEKARRKAEAERQRVTLDAERIRARCQTLAGFVREAWPILHPSTPYVHGWHIDAICEHLEAITDGRITRLLINVPPGTMKSLLVSVFWPAWEWTFRPELQYLTTSYSEGYVKRDSRRMRDLVSSDWYQALWPIKLPRTAEISFENEKRGFREGKPFASLTGGRGDRVIIDDPHSTETAESEAERLNTIRIFRESVPTRLNDPQASAIIAIMQRLHEDDVSGQIIKLGLGYEHLMLPMEFEPDRKCRTSIGFEDPRTQEGELLFPARFPRQVVERDKVPMGSYAVAGQFQQRPAPRSGGLFQRGDFEIVDAVPAGASRCRAWDFAATAPKTGKQPDWTVGLRLAEFGGTFYVEDVRRDRWSPGDVDKNLKATASQDGPNVRIRMPEDPGSAGKADAAAKTRLLAGYSVTTVRPTGDKSVRAKPAAAQAEAGNIKLVRGPWNEAFLDEVCAFPNGQFDDQVDALSDALNELALGRPVFAVPFAAMSVEPFAIPAFWPKAFGVEFDAGSAAAVWGAKDPSDGAIYLYAEHLRANEMPAVHSEAIKARGSWMRGAIGATSGSGKADSERVISTYRSHGLSLSPTDDTLEAGIQQMWQMLATGRLKVFASMQGFESQYGSYRRDDTGKIEDERSSLMNAARHLVCAWSRVASLPKPAKTFSSPARGDSRVGF